MFIEIDAENVKHSAGNAATRGASTDKVSMLVQKAPETMPASRKSRENADGHFSAAVKLDICEYNSHSSA